MDGVAAGSSAPTAIPEGIPGPSCQAATIGCYTLAEDNTCGSGFSSWLVRLKDHVTKASDYFLPPKLDDKNEYCFRPYTEI
ncbi:hypothetical protein BGZ52_002841 [Haplosporangium bisporale]|nr:hypothetical protein BGZ52_002841 [Haplosporangium bisporale]